MKKTVSRYAHSLYSSFMAMLFAAGPHSLCFFNPHRKPILLAQIRKEAKRFRSFTANRWAA